MSAAGSAVPLWARALLAIADVSPRFKRLVWRTWYQYLAGYSPFRPRAGRPALRWVALVQHERASALRPVADLTARLVTDCCVPGRNRILFFS